MKSAMFLSLLGFAAGGSLKLAFKDCGAAHGKSTGLTPDTVPLGQKTALIGSGNIDEGVSGGTFEIDLKASIISQTFKGDMCASKSFSLPLGTGTITWKGMKCPVAAGSVDVPIDIQLSSFLPGPLQNVQMTIKTAATNNDDVLCMQVNTSPADVLGLPSVAATAGMTCPGSGAWFTHAKTQVTAMVKASCADVSAEIEARASAQKGWVDPHNGGIYSIISHTDTEVQTQRQANPKHSVGGQKYIDKQVFTLVDKDGSCEVSACSESQGTSYKDFSTNYCDIRNLYCGSADGCKPVLHDFSSTQQSVKASSGQSDWSACVVKTEGVTIV